MLRIRKELIQSRSKVADLQDELEEKTSLYLNAIKVSVLSFIHPFWAKMSRNHWQFRKVCAIIKRMDAILNLFCPYYFVRIFSAKSQVSNQKCVALVKRPILRKAEQRSRQHQQSWGNRCSEGHSGPWKRETRNDPPRRREWHSQAQSRCPRQRKQNSTDQQKVTAREDYRLRRRLGILQSQPGRQRVHQENWPAQKREGGERQED